MPSGREVFRSKMTMYLSDVMQEGRNSTSKYCQAIGNIVVVASDA